jgi:hypothetical protein
MFGAKGEKGGLRDASKEKLSEVGLQLEVLRMEKNRDNMRHWRVVVDGGEGSNRGGD